MKITANRKDDILRRRQEWDDNYNRLNKQNEDEIERYHQAQQDAFKPVEEFLTNLLSKYNLLQIRVDVEAGMFGQRGIRVRLNCDEHRKFQDKVSLSWSYDAYLDKDGEVKRETSSWSGMNAVTSDQLDHLTQCLDCLRTLASLDWRNILDRQMPDWKDYVVTKVPSRNDRPNFEQELTDAELEDVIGKNKLVEVSPFTSSYFYDNRFRRNSNVFIQIIRDSGSQYTIKEVPAAAVTNREVDRYVQDNTYMHRVKKAQIKPVQPLNIVDF